MHSSGPPTAQKPGEAAAPEGQKASVEAPSPPSGPPASSRRHGKAHTLGLVVAAALPAALAVLHSAASPQWRDDTLVALGWNFHIQPGHGALSVLLLQGFRLLPLGGPAFRGALLGAAALACTGALLFLIAEQAVARHESSRRLSALLALSGSLTATLSPAMQAQGTLASSALVSAAWTLFGLHWFARRRGSLSVHHYGVLGGICALGLWESWVGGVLLLVGVCCQFIGSLRPPSRHQSLAFGSGVALASLIPGAAWWLRPMAGASIRTVGTGLFWKQLIALDVVALKARSMSEWGAHLGILALGLAALGLVLSLGRQRARLATLPFAIFVLADLIAPLANRGLVDPNPLAPLRALALGGVAICAMLGVQFLVHSLRRSKLPFNRAGAVLLVVFHMSLGALGAEESMFFVARNEQTGAERWTDAGWLELPPNAMVLVRSAVISQRLAAEKAAHASRPDVIIVPLPLLGRGRIATELLAQEPSVAPLLREIAADGHAGEFSLSVLGDIHPFYVEFDPQWEPSLARHTAPENTWLRFTSQPMGRSDRKTRRPGERLRWRRLRLASRPQGRADHATLKVLASQGRQLAIASALAGDRKSTIFMLDQLTDLAIEGQFVEELHLLLRRKKRGAVDLRRALR